MYAPSSPNILNCLAYKLFLLTYLLQTNCQRHTLVELRHDCSDKEGTNPTIATSLKTTVVYRLKSPLTDKCQGKMDKPFLWQFNLQPPVR